MTRGSPRRPASTAAAAPSGTPVWAWTMRHGGDGRSPRERRSAAVRSATGSAGGLPRIAPATASRAVGTAGIPAVPRVNGSKAAAPASAIRPSASASRRRRRMLPRRCAGSNEATQGNTRPDSSRAPTWSATNRPADGASAAGYQLETTSTSSRAVIRVPGHTRWDSSIGPGRPDSPGRAGDTPVQCQQHLELRLPCVPLMGGTKDPGTQARPSRFVEGEQVADRRRDLLALDEPGRAGLRARILRAAHERYAWEAQLEVLLALYGRVTGAAW